MAGTSLEVLGYLATAWMMPTAASYLLWTPTETVC